MRNVFLVLGLAAFLIVPAHAQQAGGTQVIEPVDAAAEPRIDRLFSELRRARNPQAAERIATRIRQEFARSGSASIDLMMGWAGEAMRERRNDVALDFLDQVTVLAPDYAEGWNRRATLHFTMGDHAKSMSDIDRTLRLEPRHFGALGGMAQILEINGRNERALDAYQRLLDVYPMLREAQDELSRLADELAGEGI